MSRNNRATETDVLRYKIAKEIFGEIEDCDGVRYIPSWEIFEKCLQQHKTIVDLKHKLEVAERTTKLACTEELRGIGIYPDDLEYKKEMSILEQQYKEQAEKELK